MQGEGLNNCTFDTKINLQSQQPVSLVKQSENPRALTSSLSWSSYATRHLIQWLGPLARQWTFLEAWTNWFVSLSKWHIGHERSNICFHLLFGLNSREGAWRSQYLPMAFVWSAVELIGSSWWGRNLRHHALTINNERQQKKSKLKNDCLTNHGLLIPDIHWWNYCDTGLDFIYSL